MIAVVEQSAPAPPPPVDPIERLQTTVSASRLNCWHQCRLKFYFRYVLQIRKPPTPALHVGSVVHEVLKAWNKGRWRKELFQIGQFKTLFDEQWGVLQKDITIDWEDEETAEQEGAWRLLEAYFVATPIKAAEKPEAVEVRVEADLTSHGLPILVGILDLVRAGGWIVDFKTSAKTPNAAQVAHLHGTQLDCYSVLYRDATGKKESALELHHLVKTKVPKVVVTRLGPMEAVRQTRLFRVMESYLEGLSRKDFVPSPGLGCFACEYFSECGAWKGKDHNA